jgi:hypothetical protein
MVNRLRTASWTARNRWACAIDLNRRMWRSRWLVDGPPEVLIAALGDEIGIFA